uniref:Uncharacterized protein n=1 Tax=Saccharum spontaneum TaxID=62335 RepID=A0A678TAL5_SACSP|nr:hypothetical protein SS47J13_000010 [Saccharum spontaneum]
MINKSHCVFGLAWRRDGGSAARPCVEASRRGGSRRREPRAVGRSRLELGGARVSWWRLHGLRISRGSWRSGRQTRAGHNRSEPPTRAGRAHSRRGARPAWIRPELGRSSLAGAGAGLERRALAGAVLEGQRGSTASRGS